MCKALRVVLPGVALLAWSAPQSAEAAALLRLTDGVNTITVADNGAGDLNPLVGAISFVGAIGPVWFTNTSAGMTKPVYPTSQIHMDLNSINTSGNAAGSPALQTLAILFTDTDWLVPTPQPVGATAGGTTNGQVQFAAYHDNANAAFALTTPIASMGPTVVTPFALTAGGVITGATPYSITQEAKVKHTGQGVQSTSFNFEIIPEPAMLLLFGLGMLGLAAARRRRTAYGVRRTAGVR